MGFYDRHVLPHLLDGLCSMGDVMRARARVVPRARGRVLEIGIGTGLNLPFYDGARVDHVCGVDPAAQMHAKARRRAARIAIPVETLPLVIEQIGADDASFDTVLTTFTLCTIAEPVPALREMRRVLKPGGMLLFCEHGRAPTAAVRGWQDRLTPVWKPIAGGCHLNRDIPALIAEGGFRIEDLDAGYLRGPKPMMYVFSGSAAKAG